MAPTVVLGLSDLQSQARACTPLQPRPIAPSSAPRQSAPLVRLVLLVTAAVLTLGAASSGPGVVGLGPPPAEATPVVDQSAAQPPATALPQTGAAPGTTSDAGAPASARRPASSCTAPCSTSQVVSVTIKPGPFEVTAAPASIAVSTGADGTGRARLDGIRVTDLRGAGEGWSLSTRVVSVVDARTRAAVPGATVELVPFCARTAGPLTLESADPSVVRVGGAASLCIVPIASQGSLAGGLVSAYADVVLRGAPSDARVEIRFATSLT